MFGSQIEMAGMGEYPLAHSSDCIPVRRVATNSGLAGQVQIATFCIVSTNVV